jgi:hypothetical protein
MKFNRTEIGGRETGAAAIRPVGTTSLEDAFAYANIGRKILGDFKQRLQQGGLKDGRFEQALQDGTVITVITNMIGLAPIDQIYVDTGQRKKIGGVIRCAGYIVQGLEVAEKISSGDAYHYRYIQTSPSGVTHDYRKIGGYVHDEPPANSNDFPDNGARYLSCGGTFGADYKAVMVAIQSNQMWAEGFGPYTWSAVSITAEEMDVPYPVVDTLPALNAGWTLVSSYSYSSGTCTDGTDSASWEEEGQICQETYHWSTIHPDQDPQIQVVYDSEQPVVQGSYYTGGHTYGGVFPVFGCSRDSAEVFTGYGTPALVVDIMEQMTAKAAAMTAVGAIQYALDLALWEGTNDFFYQGQLFSTLSGSIHYRFAEEGYKRTDGKGYWVNAGLRLATYNGRAVFHLTEAGRGGGEGRSVFFMIPTGTSRIFRYADTLQDSAYSNAYDGDDLYLGIAVGERDPLTHPSGFRIETVDYEGICGTSSQLGYNPANITRSQDPNGIVRFLDELVIADTFGVPITVEAGSHQVDVVAFQPGSSVKVWLLLDDGEKQWFEKITHEFNYVGTSARPSLRMNIMVGDLPTGAEHGVVKFEQLQ